jgi:hypothetical protein
MRALPAILLPMLLILTGANQRPTPWDAWTAELHRECPSRKVEMMSDGGYLDFLDQFSRTLSPATRQRFGRVADIRRLCAKEQLGFYCETARSLYAAQKLGLMHKIASFGCRTVKCEEAALCSRFPGRPSS